MNIFLLTVTFSYHTKLTDDAIIQTVKAVRDTKNEEQSSVKEDKNGEPTKPLIISTQCGDYICKIHNFFLGFWHVRQHL